MNKKNQQEHKENATDYLSYKEKVFKHLENLYKNKNKFYALLYFLQKLIRYKTHKDNINGKTAEDFINEAAEKILNGERIFDENKYRFDYFFFLTCISLIDNELNLLMTKCSVPLDFIDNEGEYYLNPEVENKSVQDFTNEKEDTSIDEELLKEIFHDIKKKLDDNEDYLAFSIVDDVEKKKINDIYRSNKKLAEYYGVSIKEIENAKKRIQRAFDQYKPKNEENT